MSLRPVILVLACTGALINAGATAFGGDYGNIILVLLGLAFMALGAAPFAVAILAVLRDDLPRWGEWLLLVVVLAALAFSLYAYVSFFNRTSFDAQDGLIFAVVPVYELIAMVGLRALIGAIGKFTRPR